MTDERLVDLYQQMAELTKPKCQSCRVPYSCCDAMYCRIPMRMHPELKPTGHPKLPLMGETGCIAKPHQRKLCTLHVCSINGLGFDPNDPEWTEKYFELRYQIEDTEDELFE